MDMKIINQKLNEIIVAFEDWFKKDSHSKIEDFYSNSITLESITKLNQKEFEDFFLEFAKEGGKIQSGGARTANKFIQNVHDNYGEFRQKILGPFNRDFELIDWIKWSESFSFFGKGLATIYLNRVDKRKYVIVNNKSIEAYRLLGYQVSSSYLEKTYIDLLNAQTDLLKRHPVLDNFFRADALAHFLIGTPEGKSFLVMNKYSITRESIIKAIQIIDNNPSLRRGRESIDYDLVYNGEI